MSTRRQTERSRTWSSWAVLACACAMACDSSSKDSADAAFLHDVAADVAPDVVVAPSDPASLHEVDVAARSSATNMARVGLLVDPQARIVFASSFESTHAQSSATLARFGATLVAANEDSDTITVIDEAAFGTHEIAIGDSPRHVAFSGDGRYAIVTNFAEGTLVFVDLTDDVPVLRVPIGTMPYGVNVIGRYVFVSLFGTGQIARFDVHGGQIDVVQVDPFPAGLASCVAPACALTDGTALLVTHFYSGKMTVLDPETLEIRTSVSTGATSNLSQFIVVDPAGVRAYLPQTRSNVRNPNRQFDTTVFPIVNVVDLSTAALIASARITLDTADRPVGMPFSLAFEADGGAMWIVNAASNDVSVVDVDSPIGRAHIDVGANPRGIVLSSDGTRMFVHETLDGTLAVVSVASQDVLSRVPLTTLSFDTPELRGKRLFYSSNTADICRDQWMSCGSCHFDGLTDQRTWADFPDGPRNTTGLLGIKDTLPVHWSGDLDELQDVEATVRTIQAGTGLLEREDFDTLGEPTEGASAALDDLAAFMRSLAVPASPFSSDVAAIEQGRILFESSGCASCHAAPLYTDRMRHDVGTGDAMLEHNSHGFGTSFDTPSLRSLWLSPPYFHDGSAETLQAVLTRGEAHDMHMALDDAQRAKLVAFLLSL